MASTEGKRKGGRKRGREGGKKWVGFLEGDVSLAEADTMKKEDGRGISREGGREEGRRAWVCMLVEEKGDRT